MLIRNKHHLNLGLNTVICIVRNPENENHSFKKASSGKEDN